jgi:hypothetical protein
VSFVAKDKAIVGLKVSLPKAALGPGGKQPQALRGLWALGKGVPASMVAHIQAVPIVHAAAPEVLVTHGKPQGVYEVQTRTRDRTQAANVACVLGNLGLN